MKVAIFIDGAHFSIRERENRISLDYQKLGEELTQDDFRVRTYYYDARPKPSELETEDDKLLASKKEAFSLEMEKSPRFEVKFGTLKKRNGVWRQKGVDMRLGVDMVQMSTNKNIDKVILIAADGDYAYAINKVKDSGVVTSLVTFPNDTQSPELLKAVDEITKMDTAFFEKCRFNRD